MASTITIKSQAYGTADSNGEQRYLQLVCTQTKDIANNKSTIKWTLSSKGGSAKSYATGPTTVYINGTKVCEYARKGYTTETFPNIKGSVSGSINVKHDDDGKKSITVSLTTAIYVSQTNTKSSTWTLDSIPRGASITSASNFTDLDNPTITYSNPAGNAVTSLKACISLTGSKSDIAYRDISKTKGEYTFPLTEAERTLLRNNTTGPSRTVYFYVQTEIAGSKLRDNLPKTLTIKETSGTKPTVTMTTTLNNGSLPSQFNGLYIQGKSRVNVTLSTQGKYNASITSVYGVVDGKTYNSSSFTSNVIKTSGSVKIVGYVKDSRKFTNSTTKTVTVIPYSKPLVKPLGSENAILCYRSDGKGVRVGNSTLVWLKAERSYYTVTSNDVQKNFCTLQYRFKLSTETWNNSTHPWKVLIPKSDTATSNYNALIPDIECDLKKSYTVQIRAIDDIGEYDLKTFDIPTADVALHLGKGGKHVTVGGYCDYAEEYTFTSEWKGIFNDGLRIDGGAVNGDVLAFALSCKQGVTSFATTPSSQKLPSSNYASSVGIVCKYSDTQASIYLTDYLTGSIAINVYTSGAWSGWKYLTPQ